MKATNITTATTATIMSLQPQVLLRNPLPQPNSSNAGPMSFAACHLHRSMLQNNSWGLWVTLTGDQKNALVVANVQHHCFDALVQWSYTTSSPPDANILWNRSYGSDLWKSYFSLLPAVSQTSFSTLLPGDVILAINGLPISAFGGSMTNVSHYLRQCSTIFLVAARSRSPAAQVPQQNTGNMPQSQEQVQNIMQQLSMLARLAPQQQPPQCTQQSATPHYPGWSALASPRPHSASKFDSPVKSQTGGYYRNNPSAHNMSSTVVPVTPETVHPKSSSKHVHKAACTKLKSTSTKTTPLPFSTKWRNPMFRKKYSSGDANTSSVVVLDIPYDDNDIDIEFDPEDGEQRKDQFMRRVTSANFPEWLNTRKQTWQAKWNVEASVNATKAATAGSIFLSASAMPTCWTNPMFHDDRSQGETGPTTSKNCPIQYSDNNSFDPYDGSRAREFIVPVNTSNWASWLNSRKQCWRANWNVCEIESPDEVALTSDPCERERHECSVRADFWTDRYPSFDCWLTASTAKWTKQYSWNSENRKRIQQECKEVVQFPSSLDPDTASIEFTNWLKIRKNQWRILRRRRQRRLDETTTLAVANQQLEGDVPPGGIVSVEALPLDNHPATAHMSDDFMHIDALLEEEDRRKRLRTEREPIDISFLFLPSSGCPDDIVAHTLQYLKPCEHGNLLCISKKFAAGLISRSRTWQQLCPSRWCLPRRPRKPWHELYLSKLRMEAMASRKMWDDLVSKVSDVLLKGDQLKVVMKLIEKAERKFSFTSDYTSGVVCERNSILNLAVIHQRHKVVHWLIEEKKADIETSDRGHFTPLMNAAWGGDRHLVRCLLSQGADRSKIGTGHYTEALASVDFAGLTAEGWAREKGHGDIAELIRVGI